MKYPKLFARLGLAALTCAVLAGCAASSGSDPSALGAAASHTPADPSGTTAQSGAPADQPIADSEPDTAHIPSSDPDANPMPSVSQTTQELTDSLEGTVSYGQGTAGSSLQEHKAAADVLDWVDSDNGQTVLADPDTLTLTQALEAWFASLTPAQQEHFYENWPEVDTRAQAIVDRPDDHKEPLDVAGADRNDYTDYEGDYPTFSEYVAKLYTAKYGQKPSESAQMG